MGINIEKELNIYLDELLSEDDFKVEDILDLSSKLESVQDNISKINTVNTKLYKLIKKQITSSDVLIENEVAYRNLSNIIEESKLNERILKKKESNLIKGLINIIDSIEWLFEFSLSTCEEKLKSTININRKIIKRELESLNIWETTFEGDYFNDELQICIGNKKNELLMDNQISNVVKKGYKYKDEIIRYAEVIVINNKEDLYEHNRD